MELTDYHFSGALKRQLACKQYATDSNMKAGVTSWLRHHFLYARIQELVICWDKCLNVKDDYMEV
jgi:hypothetical protein